MARQERGVFEKRRGSGVFWIDYNDAQGDRHREKVGPSKRDAQDRLALRRMEIRTGRFVPPSGGARRTFRVLGLAALKSKKARLAGSSYKSDEQRFRDLLPMIGKVPADRLTPDRIEDALLTLRQQGNTGATANRYRSLISSVFAFAIRAGKLHTNPVAKVKRYKENEGRVRWLKPDEEKRLRAVIGTTPDEMEVDLALYTGMRAGEQWGLKWAKVDWDRGILEVYGKSGQRFVEAGEEAIATLRRLQAITGESEFVSPGAEAAARPDHAWFRAALKAAGVRDFHWHDLRHTFASRLLAEGVTLREIQELLGHKNPQQTMRYAHLEKKSLERAVNKLKRKGDE
jgi:site-specific recombinase XerD